MKLESIFKATLASGSLALAYWRFVRPGIVDWGASAELTAVLPGDELLPEAGLQTTRAISIDVPTERVWPWLVQIGPRPRAGIYTYDWIERLLGIDIENANRILPQFQHLEAGEFFALDDKGKGLRVMEVRPGEAIVVRWVPGDATWAFVLRPADGGTRLISRNRIPGSGLGFRLAMAVMEPASLVMERRMLQGFKANAERPTAPVTGDAPVSFAGGANGNS